jgi:FkbM family methyltransferase
VPLRSLVLRRENYPRFSDWVFSLYDRVLNSRLGKPLPYRGRIRPVRLNGFHRPVSVRLGTTDWLVAGEMFLLAGYDEVFALNLQNVKQILDLGANIGLSGCLWQTHFSDARIVLVEPDAENLAMCRRNLVGGANPQNVAFIQACAGGAAGWVQLDRSGGQWATRMKALEATGADSQDKPIRVVRVPDLLAEGGLTGAIDLMKCDIEGAERQVFADCADWLPRIRNLIIELHDDYTPDRFMQDITRNGGRFDADVLHAAPGYAVTLLRRREDNSAARHNELIVDQFTRMAALFAQMAAHSEADSMRLLIETAGVNAEDRALDVACGPGLVSCAVAQTARHVTGVDITPAMIEQARQLQARKGLANVSWQIGDATALPFSDGTFSLVLTRYSPHHLLEPEKIVREMARVCAPNGRVVVADVFAASKEQGKAFDRMEKIRDPSHVRALPLEELKGLLSAAGLEQMRIEFYRLDVEADALLTASRTPPEAAEQVRKILAADIGKDALGVSARLVGEVIHFSFPVVILAGVLPGVQKTG